MMICSNTLSAAAQTYEFDFFSQNGTGDPYHIVVKDNGHGTITGTEDWPDTINIVPDEGYGVKSVKRSSNGSQLEKDKDAFVYYLGTYNDDTITVEYGQYHSIVPTTEHCSAYGYSWTDLSEKRFLEGDEVHLNIKLDEGYTLLKSDVTINGGAVTDLTVEVNNTGTSAYIYFNMPDADAEVVITPERIMPEGSGTKEEPFLIGSADDWELFCSRVNDGVTDFNQKYVKLSADITVSEMVGDIANKRGFGGTFDGAGHTLTFSKTAVGDYCAPFAYIGIQGTVIKNLHIAGTINVDDHGYAAGLIGYLEANIVGIENCRSSITIKYTHTDPNTTADSYFAGFTAYGRGGWNGVSYKGCVFDGQLLGTQATYCAGFGANAFDAGSSGFSGENCISAPTAVTMGKYSPFIYTKHVYLGTEYDENYDAFNGCKNCYFTVPEGVITLTPGKTPDAEESVPAALLTVTAPHAELAFSADKLTYGGDTAGSLVEAYTYNDGKYIYPLLKYDGKYFTHESETAIPFTAEPDDSYEIKAVSFNGKALTANEGSYSFTPPNSIMNELVVTTALRPLMTYIGANGKPVSTRSYKVVESRKSEVEWKNNTYVVKGDVTLPSVKFTGNVDLILCDGASLTVAGQVYAAENEGNKYTSTINIFGQSSGTGTLTCASANDLYSVALNGNINIYGGVINAGSSNQGGALGVNYASGRQADISIYGGTVNAYGEIRSNSSYATGENSINIYGGNVNVSAKGTNGIVCTDMNVSGGTVECNKRITVDRLTVSGGSVTTTGAHGICANNSKVVISGGTINTNELANSGTSKYDMIITGGNINVSEHIYTDGKGSMIGRSSTEDSYYFADSYYTSFTFDPDKPLVSADAKSTVINSKKDSSDKTLIPAAYINAVQPKKGTISSCPEVYAVGYDVTFSAAAETGYDVESVSVTGADGTDIAVTDNGDGTYTFTMPSQDVTVSADITATFAVTFSANGGKGSMETVYKKNGTHLVLPECGFTAPNGKYFSGWKIGDKDYSVGDKITVNGDIKVSAVWAECTDISEGEIGIDPITFRYNGRKKTISNITVTVGDTELDKETDYDITGNTGTDAGVYTLTVTGKGQYKGTLSAQWKIANMYKVSANINGVKSASYYEENAKAEFTSSGRGGWYINGELKSVLNTYELTVLDDTTIEWREGGFGSMATVELTSDGHVHEAAGTTRLDMTATWSVPEDADVSEAGIVYGLLDEGTERPDNEAFFDSCFSTDNKSVSASTAANGTYPFTERICGKESLCGRIYQIYRE